MNSVYSNSKALWHWGQLQSLKDGLQPYPVHVELIINDHCNHACRGCAYRLPGYSSNELFQDVEGDSKSARNPNRYIPTEKCIEILDDCKKMGVKAIQFTGGGEPTIHPDFCDIAEYALNNRFKVALVTNGSMLLNERLRQLVLRMIWTRISIDAGNHKTYMEYRDVGMKMWSTVSEGTKLLCSERWKTKSSTVIGAGFVCNPFNWHEMLQAVELYKEWGVDNVRLGLMFNPDNAKPFEPFENEMITLANRAVKQYDSPEFRVISRVAEKLQELKTGTPVLKTCYFQHFVTYIGGDQNVYRCCVYSYNKKGMIGSVKNQSFKTLWDSKAKTRNMGCFNASKCDRCQFSEINICIDGALSGSTEPDHVEFV